MDAALPKPLIVGNWKMNGLASSLGTIEAIAAGLSDRGLPAAVICPPATLVARAAGKASTSLAIGGQDCATEAQGAHTGDVSAEMLADAGARFVIVGHSERRADHGEGDATVRAKAEAAVRAGLVAIICVGETRAERDGGQAHAVVGTQLAGSVPPTATGATVVVAYEPVWAIGTGLVPAVADVADMHVFIRRTLTEALGPEAAGVRLLYGGSVKPDNAAVLLGIADVDGALIGGASLKAADFLAIAAAAGPA